MSAMCNQISHQVFMVDHVQQPLLQTLVHPMTDTHGHPRPPGPLNGSPARRQAHRQTGAPPMRVRAP
jgi:hypothetical protein